MDRTFKIQTLSSKQLNPSYTKLQYKSRLGFDPVLILTAGSSILNNIFPGFLQSPEPLTDQELQNLFPGGGYWSTQLRSYLKSKTKWKKDMGYWYPGNFGPGGSWSRGYIAQFVIDNRKQICPNASDQCWSNALCQECMTAFSQILQQEKLTGGQSPAGLYPGSLASINWSTILIVGAVIGGLALVMKKKKTNRKK